MNLRAIPKPAILGILFLTCSCRALIYNVPGLKDYKIFPYREIQNSPESVFHFDYAPPDQNYGKLLLTNNNILLPDAVTLEEYASGTKTAAYLVIRNDTILFEKYNKGYQESSIFNTFSVTKAFITTLVGIALMEGKIQSLDQSITEFLPELKEIEGFDKITLRHLLLHTSGIAFSDTRFSVFSDNAKYYYGRNLRKLVTKADLYIEPGQEIRYGSTNVQLLGMALEKATGTSISAYLEEKIWKKIGMQYPATWSLDSKREEGMEKAFSSLNCRAVDLAKLGRLYLHRGLWEDERILPEAFVEEATRRDTTAGSSWNFQYNFRQGPELYGSYYARGLFGQLIYIYPKKNIIIVRVGETDLHYNPQFMNYNVLQIIDQL